MKIKHNFKPNTICFTFKEKHIWKYVVSHNMKKKHQEHTWKILFYCTYYCEFIHWWGKRATCSTVALLLHTETADGGFRRKIDFKKNREGWRELVVKNE